MICSSIVFKFFVWQSKIGCQALKALMSFKWQYGYKALRVVSYFHKHPKWITEIAQFMWKYLFIRSIMSRLFTSTYYARAAEIHTFIKCSFFQVSSQEIFRTWFNTRGLHISLCRHTKRKVKLACKESKHARQSCKVKREMRWNATTTAKHNNNRYKWKRNWNRMKIWDKWSLTTLATTNRPPNTVHFNRI